MNNNTRIQYRDKCTNSEVEGSFTDCRAQERIVAYYGEKCKTCTGMTTKVRRRFTQKDKFVKFLYCRPRLKDFYETDCRGLLEDRESGLETTTENFVLSLINELELYSNCLDQKYF